MEKMPVWRAGFEIDSYEFDGCAGALETAGIGVTPEQNCGRVRLAPRPDSRRGTGHK